MGLILALERLYIGQNGLTILRRSWSESLLNGCDWPGLG